MFDVGFTEIMVIAVVALIVLGPEKLPKTARTLGHLFGRLQRYVADVKADINREMELEESEEAAGRRCRPRPPSSSRRCTTATQEVETDVRDVEVRAQCRGSDGSPAGASRWRPGSQLPASAPPGYRQRARRAGSRRRAAARRRCRVFDVADAGRRRAAMSDALHAAPDGPQETFISHLVELRTRLVRAIVAVLVVLLVPVPVGEGNLRGARRAAPARAAEGRDDDRDRRHRHVPSSRSRSR